MDKYNLERFLTAQALNYDDALEELHSGRKRSHWMWYVFPQLRFLGRSDRAYFYGISCADEAREYCKNKTLHGRYLACCKALENVKETDPEAVMGDIDAIKLRSSLTLFYYVDEENRPLYHRLVEKFFGGEYDEQTLDSLKKNP